MPQSLKNAGLLSSHADVDIEIDIDLRHIKYDFSASLLCQLMI